MKGKKAAQFVVDSYRKLLALTVNDCHMIGKTVAIPSFDASLIIDICEAARQHFERCDIILELHAPFYIVGDIHGNIFDLIRVITSMPPPGGRFLFLGDYVDRGEYSIECVTLLFSLMLVYPEHVFLLRGNHEFESMNSSYGFADEVMSQYQSKKIYDACNDAFMYMPLCAIFNGQIFCVHGGICPRVKNLAELRKIKRPLPTYDVEFVADLVWSDPCYDSRSFDESRRGLGVQFGEQALQDFLECMGMKMMIRAHQCVQSGISRFGEDLLYTVFSCSNYVDSHGNRCGLLFLSMQLQLQMFSLPPIEQLPRQFVLFEEKQMTDETMEMRADDSITLHLTLQELRRRKVTKSKLSMLQRSRENILQRFHSLRMKRSGTAALLPIVGRSASADFNLSLRALEPLKKAPEGESNNM